jgi:hypothetical protein
MAGVSARRDAPGPAELEEVFRDDLGHAPRVEPRLFPPQLLLERPKKLDLVVREVDHAPGLLSPGARAADGAGRLAPRP